MRETILNQEIFTSKTASRLFGVIAFIILTSLGAFVRIPLPFTPVPITLQTFFVLLSGAFLGSSLGVITQLSYALLGVLGLPIFSQTGSGVFYLLGPTGGYIIGFILASLFVGRSIDYAKNNSLLVLVIFCVGDFILLACGTIWLRIIFGYSLAKLLFIGFIPFIPGDLLKAGLAAGLYLRLKYRLKEIF